MHLFPLRLVAVTIIAASLLSGCVAAVVGGAAVGAHAVHDRRSVRTVIGDRNIQMSAASALASDQELAHNSRIIVIVHDGVMLLAGEVRSSALNQRAEQLASGYRGVSRLVNEIDVREPLGFWARRSDNTLTARVKTALIDITSMPGFDPTRVNVTTAHRTVHLMGLVSHEEGEAVSTIARHVRGVEKVVKVFDYTD